MSSSGALKRMLAEKAGVTPSPAPTATGAAEQSTSIHARQIYPLKGPAQLPPDCLRPWKYADRGDFEFDHVDQLADSFGKDGQLQPAIVRPAADLSNPAIRYEIIAGRARWLSAKKAGTKLDVVIRPNLTDEEAFRVMVQENESRRDLSDYSKGKRFRRALDDGLYPSQTALAKVFNISEPTVTRLLATASLDDRVVRAFSSPAVIGNALGMALKKAEEAGLTAAIVRDAKRIESGEIRLSDIPSVWTRGAAAAEPAAADDTGGQGDSRDGAAQASPGTTKRFFGTNGKALFVVKTAPDRLPSVRFKVPVDDAFFDELKTFVERRMKKKRG